MKKKAEHKVVPNFMRHIVDGVSIIAALAITLYIVSILFGDGMETGTEGDMVFGVIVFSIVICGGTSRLISFLATKLLFNPLEKKGILFYPHKNVFSMTSYDSDKNERTFMHEYDDGSIKMQVFDCHGVMIKEEIKLK